MLIEGENIYVIGLLVFVLEILCCVCLLDMMWVKQMCQGLQDLVEEGFVQIFKLDLGFNWIVGVVGVLQFDVVVDCLKVEYGIEIGFEIVFYLMVCWIEIDQLIL